MSYELVWEPQGVTSRYAGVFSRNDLSFSVRRIHGDYRFDDLRFVIHDCLDVESISATFADIDEVAATDKAAALTNPRIVVAFVSTQPSITSLAHRYAYSEMNAYPTRVFPSRLEARSWIAGVSQISTVQRNIRF